MNYNELYERMKEDVSRMGGVLVNDGGDMSLRLSAVASQLESLWVQAEWTKRQCFPQTASGEHLDMHAQARGLMRTGPTTAEGTIRFETDSVRQQTLLVEKGTVCLNQAGTEFLTTEQGEIKAGELFCLVAAAARKEGASGNAAAESVSLMALAPIGVVRCFNPEPFSGGSDGETDNLLRDRVLKSYGNLPNGSNRAYYESVALDTDGVAAACVLPRRRGIGTVDIIIAGASGQPTQDVISLVSERLSLNREICVDIEVMAPETVSVPVSVAIEVQEGYDFSKVAEEVRLALTRYFDGRLLGKSVLLAKLGSIVFGAEGVSNYSFTLPAADVNILSEELPVATSISVVGR